MLHEIVTIGAYGWEEEAFFAALRAARVDLFCDIRQRRGVRGHEYAFANSQRLQDRLAAGAFRYVHRLDLAPSAGLRAVQMAADSATHTATRRREALSDEFIRAYGEQVLAGFDSRSFADSLGPDAHVVALFCVERVHTACHRGLLANRLARDLRLPLMHLTPP